MARLLPALTFYPSPAMAGEAPADTDPPRSRGA
jgi:hypothetical protein